jgi:hypothetical protein
MRSSGEAESKLFFNQVKQKEVVVNGSSGRIGFRNLIGIVTETLPSAFTVRTRDGDVSFDFRSAKISRLADSVNEWALRLPNRETLYVKRR